MIAGYSRSRI